jgi:hypothetical protein
MSLKGSIMRWLPSQEHTRYNLRNWDWRFSNSKARFTIWRQKMIFHRWPSWPMRRKFSVWSQRFPKSRSNYSLRSKKFSVRTNSSSSIAAKYRNSIDLCSSWRRRKSSWTKSCYQHKKNFRLRRTTTRSTRDYFWRKRKRIRRLKDLTRT